MKHYETFLTNSPIIAYFKNIIFVQVEKTDFRNGRVEKWGQNWKNCHFSRNIRGNCSNLCPERIEAAFLHVHDPNSPSFYVKCPRKCQKKTIILTFF